MPLTEYDFNAENAVDRIFYGRIAIEKAAAFLFFTENGIVKNLIHYLKYKNQPQIGAFLADWFGQSLIDSGGAPQIDLVVPVPLHPKKLRKRGYNQVSRFGERLAHLFEAEYREHALERTSHTATQTHKNRWYRWQSSRELFTLNEVELLAHRSVLLVDDVVTTGATLEACTKALQQAEGIRVYIACMAIVP